jgi:hypothetical protein
MEVTNYLDVLPVELHKNIADILESDRRWHDWEKAKKHLEENFIRSYKRNYYEIKEYNVKNQNIVYYDWDEDEDDYDECICICYPDTSMVCISDTGFERIDKLL